MMKSAKDGLVVGSIGPEDPAQVALVQDHDVIQARKSSTTALVAAVEHTQTLSNIERAYVVGGGDTVTILGQSYFRVDVANYGKTPAFLTAFDIQFAKLLAWPCTVSPLRPYDDQLPPGLVKHGIDHIPVSSGAEVIYGAFWYHDRGKERRSFRFILRWPRRPHAARCRGRRRQLQRMELTATRAMTPSRHAALFQQPAPVLCDGH
jgi:hypothetical protein